MMKPIVKKVLESGIVETNVVRLMERWGQLDHGVSDTVASSDLRITTEEALNSFVEDIALLIEEDKALLSEARLVVRVGDPIRVDWVSGPFVTPYKYTIVFRDSEGEDTFIFPTKDKKLINLGAVFRIEDDYYTILDFTSLRVTPSKGPYGIQVNASIS